MEIEEYVGIVKLEETLDKQCIEKVTIGEDELYELDWSFLEKYKGKRVRLTVELLEDSIQEGQTSEN